MLCSKKNSYDINIEENRYVILENYSFLLKIIMLVLLLFVFISLIIFIYAISSNNINNTKIIFYKLNCELTCDVIYINNNHTSYTINNVTISDKFNFNDRNIFNAYLKNCDKDDNKECHVIYYGKIYNNTMNKINFYYSLNDINIKESVKLYKKYYYRNNKELINNSNKLKKENKLIKTKILYSLSIIVICFVIVSIISFIYLYIHYIKSTIDY